MKVMQINCNDRGSIGKIMNTIADALTANGHTCVICYSLGAPTEKERRSYKVSGRFEPGTNYRLNRLIGIPYGFAPIATLCLIRILNQERPDVVHLHCPNSNMNVYRILSYIGKKDIPTVLTNHCEMFYTGNCPHSYECERFVEGCGSCQHLKTYCKSYFIDNTHRAWQKMHDAVASVPRIAVTSVSSWVNERSMRSPITACVPNHVIENSINTSVYYPRRVNIEALRKKYGIPTGTRLALFVTANFNIHPDHPKGGYYLVRLAQMMQNENISFVVVGSRTKTEGLPPNVIDIGRVENEDALSELYSAADISLVLSRKETFSMTCAEAQCCSTPAVGFRAGGPESISLLQYSEFCEYGDLDALEHLVRKWLMFKSELADPEEISKCAHVKFHENRMTEKYIQLYQSLLCMKEQDKALR